MKFALFKIEKTCGNKIYVTTSYSKSDFDKTLISIDECKSPYDLLCIKDKEVCKLNEKFGTTNEWQTLLENFQNNSIENTLKKYVNTKDILSEIKDWTVKDRFKQWALFIYLKLKNIHIDNWSIDYAIEKSQNSDKFLYNIYQSILEVNFNEPEFWKKYVDTI